MAQAIVEYAGSTLRGHKPAFTHDILESVLRFLARRRTQRELERLDDHMLADIGLSRGDIHMAAAQATGVPSQKRTSFGAEWLSLMLAARKRAGMVRSLRQLPDHILNDIGIQRWHIEESVYRIMAESAAKVTQSRTGTDQASPVHGLLHRLEAATWPFRRAQTSHAEAGQAAHLEVTEEQRLKSAANHNQARAGVA